MGYHGSNCATKHTQRQCGGLECRSKPIRWTRMVRTHLPSVRAQRVTFDPAQTRSRECIHGEQRKGRSSQWQLPCRSCPCSSHVAMSNVASSGEQEEGRVSPPSTSGNAQLIPPEPASVRCEVEKVVLCMIWGSLSSGSGMVTVQVEELKFPISLSYYTLYCENMELRFPHSGVWKHSLMFVKRFTALKT